jgi:AcrR family transcriptional regulator
MITAIEQPWILAGYELFASGGPHDLKIEKIARKVGISKSSFYHHFATLAIFQEKLMAYHLDYAKEVAERTRECKTMIPDFVHLLEELRLYVFFNRQLRIHKKNIAFQVCYEHAVSLVVKALNPLWSQMMGLTHEPDISRNVLKVATDLFYHRINVENYNYEWAESFLHEFKGCMEDVIRISNRTKQAVVNS